VFALVAAALATFGAGGILAAAFTLGFWRFVYSAQSPRKRCVLSIAVLTLLILAAALARPAMVGIRNIPATTTSAHQLKQLLAAIDKHNASRGASPFDESDSGRGGPTTSWRVKLLPHIDRNDLYEQYDFNQPWNGPANRSLAKHMPEEFTRPEQGTDLESDGFAADYLAVVGPRATATKNQRARRLESLGPRILLIEVSDSGIHWMEPRDLTQSEAIQLLTAPPRPYTQIVRDAFLYRTAAIQRGRPVGFSNGRIAFLGQVADANVATALVSGIGSDDALVDKSLADYAGTIDSHREYKWPTIYGLALFLLLALLPAAKLFHAPRHIVKFVPAPMILQR
jgi:hypothetical protein